MAIFFPLFTLLEDIGYLPRVAFNLDGVFSKCNACGKQALSMCMGLGCNAAGVVGTRIIDSKRERLVAILTNNFMPCNGRFPAIITISTIFFSGVSGISSLIIALILAAVIVLESWQHCDHEDPYLHHPAWGTFLFHFGDASLSKAADRENPYSLDPRPDDICAWPCSGGSGAGGRTDLFAVQLGDRGVPITGWVSDFLDPLGLLMGLDGVILLAFLLGLPANEIVLPLCAMLYMSSGTLSEIGDLSVLRETFAANGWTSVTAACFILFSLMHWPCSTTLITVKKETGSWRYVLLAFLIPTILGIVCCMALHAVDVLFF